MNQISRVAVPSRRAVGFDWTGKAPAVLKHGRTKDSMLTFDWHNELTLDGPGAFLRGELERLDQTLHEPLAAVTWGRDIDLREDVTIGDEWSSYTNSSFAAQGGISPNGIAWIGKDANAIQGIALDIGKTNSPLMLWGHEISFTIPELESAKLLGRSVDSQKYDGMQLKHQMDIDQMVYIGDPMLTNVFGLINSPQVPTVYNVANGLSGSPQWSTKTPDEILADVNQLLDTVWSASAWALIPNELRLPPTEFSYLVSQKVSDAGNISVLEFLKQNNLCRASNNVDLNIQPVKWLIGAGAGGTNRMVAYTKEKERVRYPMTPLQRTPIEYRSIWQMTTYFGRLGVMEFPYPQTLGYADGIGP